MKKIIFTLFLSLAIFFVGCDITTITPEKRMEDVKNELLKEYDLNNITSDIVLKTSTRGVKITWISSNENVITPNGKVTIPLMDTNVRLTANLKYLDLVDSVMFNLTIKGAGGGIDLTQEVENLKAHLSRNYDNIKISSNLIFVNIFEEFIISWESSNTSVLSNDGTVTQQNEDVVVEVKATFYHQTEPNTNYDISFNITVLKKEVVVTNSLEEALKHVTNYYAEFEMADGTYNDTYYLYVDENILMQYTESFGTEYLEYDELSNVYYYYGLVYNEWIKISSLDPDFENYAYFVIFDITNLDANHFIYQDGVYVAKPEYVDEVGVSIFDAYENEIYNDVRITVENNRITQISASSTCLTENYEYLVNLSDFDTIIIELPNVSTETEEITILDALNTSDGQVVTVTGVITNIVGQSFYITDETGSLYVYSKVENDAIALGNEITITGTMDSFSGLKELTDYTDLKVIGEKSYEATLIKDLDNTTLEKYLAAPISLSGVSIVTLPTNMSTTSDYSFTISDGTNSIMVFVKKNLDVNTNTAIQEYLSRKNVGDIIKIENATISYYNGYQIAVTLGTVISDGYNDGDPVTLSYLSTTTDNLTVNYGTSLEDVLSSLSIKKHYSNGSAEKAVITEYKVETDYSAFMAGNYQITITIGTVNIKINVTVSNKPTDTYKPEIGDIPLLTDTIKTLWTPGLDQALNNTGTQNILIIPVDFTDYSASPTIKSNLETAAFGTSNEAGWESLQSYYYKSSYGKLTIQGQVLDVFHTNKRSTSFSNNTGSYDILTSAIEYYDNLIDYSKFDGNNDGYIDGIYLVYTAPVNYNDSNSLWWAFCDMFIESGEELKFDNTGLEFYLFMGYDFFDEAFIYGETENDDVYVKLNTQTIIHETGHLLGLNDYYGNYESPCYSTGGGIMMDLNIADQDPFSKIIMGWTSPYIVNGTSTTITLNPFESSGDVILIPYNWNGSYFSEYLLVDYYTPTGLNEIFSGYNGVFSKNGIRIYHINATLKMSAEYVWDIYQNELGTANQIIKLVENDTSNAIINNYFATNEDLFVANDSLTNYKWDNNTSVNFEINVISVSNTEARVSISFQ